ncbi:hypothetical protein QLQ15_13340 [Lysobacter sp. LF1]|uniref:tRNA_anti-like n=1 Tax=Lysobacter stagni TaxID=3045172 RepID=A0ABT6XIA7_9GAMM|nr:hypothetical protein [Lysobacter sp. LF1]MDI9239890.1 hypothetical protein [Lysobacter sp. LF1]
MKSLRCLAIIIAGLLVAGLIGKVTEEGRPNAGGVARLGAAPNGDENPLQGVIVRQQAVEALPEVAAVELARAYEENPSAADSKYKGKRYRVTGMVAGVNTDFFGDQYLTLRGGQNEFGEPQFQFHEESLAALALLAEGDEVMLVCVGAGDIVRTPLSKECLLL